MTKSGGLLQYRFCFKAEQDRTLSLPVCMSNPAEFLKENFDGKPSLEQDQTQPQEWLSRADADQKRQENLKQETPRRAVRQYRLSQDNSLTAEAADSSFVMTMENGGRREIILIFTYQLIGYVNYYIIAIASCIFQKYQPCKSPLKQSKP